MTFEVTILGSNSAFPAHGRYPSAQVVNHRNNLYLIDCAEGTQVRMADFGVKRTRIDHIFISHLHGDHVYGLPGFMNSLAHADRQRTLHIYGPKGIAQLMDTVLRLTSSIVQYDIVYHEIDSADRRKLLDDGSMRVYCFPLKHRVPTYGYLFRERPREPNVLKSAIRKYDLTVRDILDIKAGKGYVDERGISVPEEELMRKNPSRAYAYCSDTLYDPGLVPHLKGVDLLYHEATFLHELEPKAIESKHSTAFQAAMIARLADVGELIIGHYSSRYSDVEPLQAEAREVFLDAHLAIEGKSYAVGPQ